MSLSTALKFVNSSVDHSHRWFEITRKYTTKVVRSTLSVMLPVISAAIAGGATYAANKLCHLPPTFSAGCANPIASTVPIAVVAGIAAITGGGASGAAAVGAGGAVLPVSLLVGGSAIVVINAGFAAILARVLPIQNRRFAAASGAALSTILMGLTLNLASLLNRWNDLGLIGHIFDSVVTLAAGCLAAGIASIPLPKLREEAPLWERKKEHMA